MKFKRIYRCSGGRHAGNVWDKSPETMKHGNGGQLMLLNYYPTPLLAQKQVKKEAAWTHTSLREVGRLNVPINKTFCHKGKSVQGCQVLSVRQEKRGHCHGVEHGYCCLRGKLARSSGSSLFLNMATLRKLPVLVFWKAIISFLVCWTVGKKGDSVPVSEWKREMLDSNNINTYLCLNLAYIKSAQSTVWPHFNSLKPTKEHEVCDNN